MRPLGGVHIHRAQRIDKATLIEIQRGAVLIAEAAHQNALSHAAVAFDHQRKGLPLGPDHRVPRQAGRHHVRHPAQHKFKQRQMPQRAVEKQI